jgi:cellulose synthase/poly-beta-1,6-N-acetylglucosamine synthase-like glycosyltransferase
MAAGIGRFGVLVIVLLVCGMGWAIAAAAGILAGSGRILVYILANLVLTLDLIDLVLRAWLKRIHGRTEPGPSIDLGLTDISNSERSMVLQPYAVVASVHNASGNLDLLLETLAPIKAFVWFIDDASNDATALRLQRQGWRCVASAVNRKKPGALLQLIKTLPSEVQTVVVLDPDVRWTASPAAARPMLERIISDLQRSGAAALTPRVRAARGGWLVECQALEYELSCGIGRKSLGDLCCNSGVSVYRRSALQWVLARHSLSVYAEDFENSLLLLAAGERIYYDDRMFIETHAKTTWKALFSQRVGWSFGCAKMFVERLPELVKVARRSPIAAYQYLLYLGVNSIVLLPLKWLSVGVLLMSLLKSIDELFMTHVIPAFSWNEPLLFSIWYGKSLAILALACLVAVPRKDRLRHLAILPLYALYSITLYLPVTVGYLNVVAMKLWGKRLYEDHYDRFPVFRSRRELPTDSAPLSNVARS